MGRPHGRKLMNRSEEEEEKEDKGKDHNG